MTHFSGRNPSIVIALAFVLAVLAGCEKNPEERLLGKWISVHEVPEEKGSESDSNDALPFMEFAFFRDETCTLRFNASVPFVGRVPTLPCDWILSGNNLLKLEIRFPDGEIMVETYSIRFQGNRLELEESNGSSTGFERVPGSR
ncbi:MAG: hypothetical protein KGY48_11375 [Wenzhouxiangellaceae bacterium]|nr:hypothetical protein [Wenzhouxiangellaceae bacterium]